MQTVEFSLGPLLIEIERSMNEQMGLVLSNFMPLSADFNAIQPAGIFVSSIIAASISDRCGALSVGDQILSVDETVVENTSFTPDDVIQLLDSNCTKGFTQIQILPAHAILRRKGKHERENICFIFNRGSVAGLHHIEKSNLVGRILPPQITSLRLLLCAAETFHDHQIPQRLTSSPGTAVVALHCIAFSISAGKSTWGKRS
jgi:PDZ domain